LGAVDIQLTTILVLLQEMDARKQFISTPESFEINVYILSSISCLYVTYVRNAGCGQLSSE